MDTRLARHILADDQHRAIIADCGVISVTYYAAISRYSWPRKGRGQEMGREVQVLVQNERVYMDVHAMTWMMHVCELRGSLEVAMPRSLQPLSGRWA